MSNILPKTRIARFHKEIDYVAKEITEDSFATQQNRMNIYHRVGKDTHIYATYLKGGGIDLSNSVSIEIEFEYKRELLSFFYDVDNYDNVNYRFSRNWDEDSIDCHCDFMIPKEITDEELFQLSLMQDMSYLTIDIHNGLLQVCAALLTRIDEMVEAEMVKLNG